MPLLLLFCVAIHAAPPGFPLPSLPEGSVTGERCTKLLCNLGGRSEHRAAARLAELYATDRKAFAEALEAVKNGSVYKLVFQDEDLPSQFEFKIPVGIPSTEIGRRW